MFCLFNFRSTVNNLTNFGSKYSFIEIAHNIIMIRILMFGICSIYLQRQFIIFLKFFQGSKSLGSMISQRKRLPAWNKQDDILAALKTNQVLVISGMTG